MISHGQAIAAGLSPAGIRRRVGSGAWERLHPGVYRVTDRPRSAEARLRAAALWAGSDAHPATVDGLAAAWWHDLWPALPPVVGITVPRCRRRRPRPGVRLRRRDLAATDVVALRELPVTDLPLTVLEAAVQIGVEGPALLDRALQRRVRFPALCRAHFRNLGREGSPAASTLLAVAADRADSAAERRLMSLLRDAGVLGWARGFRTCGYRLDLAFPEERVAVEVDGWAWHVDVERFQRDRVRQNALVNAGWRVLRFTWTDLVADPHRVVAEIRAALGTRAA